MDIALLLIFFLELTLLYIMSRSSISQLFRILRKFFHDDRMVYGIISVLFFPGTVIHELSHFVMASLLMLRVHDIHVFPEWDGRSLKLGRVIYQKADPVRSILVGIAPLFVGLLILWWLYSIEIITNDSILVRTLTIGFIFIMTTSMFSSKQDLVDLIYVLPVGLILAGIWYVFQIDISQVVTPSFVEGLNDFLYAINVYLGISLGIHVVLVATLRLLHILKQT